MNKVLPNFQFENELKSEYNSIAGVDEVGRGCLAGPVFAASAILNFDKRFANIGINDSKLLNENKRKLIFQIIKDNGIDFSFEKIDSNEIDKINILQASKKAMLKSILSLKTKADFILVDGNQKLNVEIPQKTIIKGDSKSLSIASASIIAKCERDKFMIEIVHNKYPQYGFDKHKGYATKEHFKAITQYGETEFHRKTFLRKYYIKQLSFF